MGAVVSWRASGLKAWAWQRLSAIYLALYVLTAVTCIAANAPLDYPAWRAAFATTVVNLSTALAALCLLIHAWVGVRDIILDYLRPPLLRFTALGGTALALILMALWALFILSGAYA